jgi:hypothetical protein
MAMKAARTSLSIRILTGLILAMAVAFVVGGMYDPHMLVGAAILSAIAFPCYLFAPVAYEISGGRLRVVFRAGEKRFGPVTACSRVTERHPFTVRLFGNGGLFAGTGIYWNRPYGVFRAYVTSARPQDAVLVETGQGKVIVTPEDPARFVETVRRA